MHAIVVVTVTGNNLISTFKGQRKFVRQRNPKNTIGEDVKALVEETVRATSDPKNWAIGIDAEDGRYIAVYVDNHSRVAK